MLDVLDDDKISRTLSRFDAETVSGLYFRYVRPEYAGDPLSPAGARRGGGRYNSAGMNALYASSTGEIALEEILQTIEFWMEERAEEQLPRTLFGIDLQLSEVLDITKREVRRIIEEELGITKRNLTAWDWKEQVSRGSRPITHRLGTIASVMRFEAMKVPSAREGEGHNLVVFTDNVRAPSRLECTGIVSQIARRRVVWPIEL